MVPMFFILVTSFMTQEQALTSSLIPKPFNFRNYLDVFQRDPAAPVHLEHHAGGRAHDGRHDRVLRAGCVRLARMQWRGRQFAFVAVLATLMLPFQVTIVPLYIIFVRLDWIII